MEAVRLNQSPSQLDDRLVVKRVLAGEKELFEILLRRYNQSLYRVIRSYLRNEDEVEDAMQNAYLKAYDKLSQFQGNSAFSTWLIRIGINEALMRLRDLKKEKDLHIVRSDEVTLTLNQIPDMQVNPERQLIIKESERLLESAIDNLPEKYRHVYVLKEVQCLSNEEIAECLAISHDNVKVRIHRAKALLKENLYQMSNIKSVFEFGNSRCDEIVNRVMTLI